MAMHSYTAIVEKEGDVYVALCPELDVASQGASIEQATTNLKEAIKDVDVINLLRIQSERQSQSYFPSIREYANSYQINSEVLRRAKPDVLIMHPGPINRDVEISADLADGEHSVILQQVTNGVAIRMAVLYLLGVST